MAIVNIPWFTGAPVGGVSPYFGKAERKRRQLTAITQGLYDVGALLRKERSKGLPPGATDADLEAEEQQLESQLQHQQGKARDDTTHGVERATTQGDHAKADAIKSDPAGYASEDQGFLPKLGDFMKKGAERLLWGDPKRQERLSHIRQMKGELQAEKDRENFFKTAGQVCMKSDDPDACLREAGGGRYGMTHLPKATPTKLTTTPDIYLPDKSIGGGLNDRMDVTEAERQVRQDHGGTMPSDPDVARSEVYRKLQQIRQSRETKKNDDRDRRQRDMVNYRMAQQAAREQAREARKAAAGGDESVIESWGEWKDNQGIHYQMDDLRGAEMQQKYPQLGFQKVKIAVHYKRPGGTAAGGGAGAPEGGAPRPTPTEPDPGAQFGAPNFFAPNIEGVP